MLYDPKWETKTREPTQADFMNWLREQDPNKEYDYGSFTKCPCAQYSHSCGFMNAKWVLDPRFSDIHTAISVAMIKANWRISLGTFGQLLEAMS